MAVYILVRIQKNISKGFLLQKKTFAFLSIVKMEGAHIYRRPHGGADGEGVRKKSKSWLCMGKIYIFAA